MDIAFDRADLHVSLPGYRHVVGPHGLPTRAHTPVIDAQGEARAVQHPFATERRHRQRVEVLTRTRGFERLLTCTGN